jgi:hypothetical protein
MDVEKTTNGWKTLPFRDGALKGAVGHFELFEVGGLGEEGRNGRWERRGGGGRGEAGLKPEKRKDKGLSRRAR